MEHSALISIGLPISLFLIMVGMGLTLTLKDFQQSTSAPWPDLWYCLSAVGAACYRLRFGGAV